MDVMTYKEAVQNLTIQQMDVIRSGIINQDPWFSGYLLSVIALVFIAGVCIGWLYTHPGQRSVRQIVWENYKKRLLADEEISNEEIRQQIIKDKEKAKK